ncbi:DNA-binding transcriptional LysR family regulator [Rhizobium sp. PP-F2F-G48]|uniref:LysR family transcriptional regulator n=1 Tax=Rhizobium sp. PP-F2F-G48 TaxID=2135651 RepID=UPI0010479934|nr:LysR substrate-binding domain-containing protein [Rhizobium sp. PP-F2F-G48]TCM46504.1 DNA-binding transcriptional LysR family regulator [Rhizobium sp. PP-F2F-G48]
MEIRQLRTVVHVAELGSISGAAERLHIAQPALTRQIQALEDELTIRLFYRHGRGVRLTGQGAAFLARAKRILHEVEQARTEFISDDAALYGEIAVGMPPTVSDTLSTILIEKFLREHPNVKLRVVSGYSGHILDWLQKGVIDLGIIYDAKHPATIVSQPILLEKLFLVQRATKVPLKDEATLEEAVTLPLILPSQQHGLRLLIDDVATRHGFTITPIVEVDSLPVQIDLVCRGLGATILPYLPVFRRVEAGLLEARPLMSPPITRQLILARTVGRPESAAVRKFAELITREISQLVTNGHWLGVLT